MTNDELNQYLKRYIEKDKTGRAIMLTGDWGIGKSYYVKNILIPFLAKTENGEHKCIAVSLYGVSSLSEVSKAIYMEARAKILSPESEAGQAVVLAGKTIIKSVASFFGVDLSIEEDRLKELYKSIDLSGKLIIFEDVERAEISILQFLGYVNSLVEQDGVKVLLVTNEKEILKYKSVGNHKEDVNFLGDKTEPKEYTDETIRYLEIKEKSVGDTIRFSGDFKSAIKGIIQSFDDNPILKKYSDDQSVQDISEIMYLMRSNNLRSVIYACQKTADIYEQISCEALSEDFLRTILYGIIAFSLRIHAGGDSKWVGLERYSQELGLRNYPLFRFCYDYVLTQQFDTSVIPIAVKSLEKLRLYDSEKSAGDFDLQRLYGFYLLSEKEVKTVVEKITDRLKDPTDISFYQYAKIAVYLIKIKNVLEISIDSAKACLVNNLSGKGNELKADDLFWYIMDDDYPAERDEFVSLREEMIKSLNKNIGFFSQFSYSPEEATSLYEYVKQNTAAIWTARGFAKNMDIPMLIEMFSRCTPKQMDTIRGAFKKVYKPENIRDLLSDDFVAIVELRNGIIEKRNSSNADKIQLLQYKWFIEVLTTIKDKLLLI